MNSQGPWRPIARAPNSSRSPVGRDVLPRRKNASKACVVCRERKSRCVGGVPCEPCRSRNTACVIDEEGDNRRKITVKRKIESLEQDRDTLLRLLDALRSNNEESAGKLLDLIQSNAPLDEIRRFLAANLPKAAVSDPEAQALRALGSNTRRKVMDVNRISDIPIHRVPARPWTTVTDDDDLVSHLVSLYFTWNHPMLNWIDRDLFIKDMKSKNLESRFCTPHLVNAVLASACFYSNYPEVFATQDDRTSRGRHFYYEAKRLLDKEEGKVTLPTVQAFAEIWIITCVIGKDRLGRQYQRQVGEHALELMSKRSRIVEHAGAQGPEMTRALDTALYGLFSSSMTASLALQRPAVMKKPKLEYMPQDHDPRDTWTPYPVQTGSVAAHTNCVMNSSFDLHVILCDITNYFFSDEKPPRIDWERMINSFHARLQHWSQQLPGCISLGHTSAPAIADLHMRYHVAILTIFAPIKSQSDGFSLEFTDRARELRLSAARQIRVLANLHRTKWPIQYAPVTCMQWAVLALFTLLEDVDSPESGAAFIDICIILRAMGRRWQLAKGMLRLVQITAKQMNIDLPREAESLLRDFETELWEADDREHFSSAYPNFAVTMGGMGESVDEAELDSVLAKWDNLRLDAETKLSKTTGAEADAGSAES